MSLKYCYECDFARPFGLRSVDSSFTAASVDSLEGRHSLTLVVQGVEDDVSVFDLWLLCWVVQVSESVLHPLVIESLSEVISSVGSTGLFSVLGGEHGHLGLDHQVLKLHCLDQVSVPDVAAVADSDVSDALGNLVKLVTALLEVILTTEHSGVFLHSLLHLQSDLGSWGSSG